MTQRFRGKLSYANVTATLALFVALGGSSYAAFSLPRNSVGPAQIRTGAVHSRQVKDRSLQVADLSMRARRSLHGATGPRGPQGAAGPAGAPAVRHFAVMRANGVLAGGDATSGGSGGAIGTFVVGFAQPVAGCAYSATLGSDDGSSVTPGRVTVRPLDGRVGVQTYDSAGNPANLPFHLIVAC